MDFERFVERMQAEGYTYVATEESDRSSSLYHEFEHEHGLFIVRDSDHDANCGWHVLLNLDIWDLEEWEFSFVVEILKLNIAMYKHCGKRYLHHNPQQFRRIEGKSVSIDEKPKPVCISLEKTTEELYWIARRFHLLSHIHHMSSKRNFGLWEVKQAMQNRSTRMLGEDAREFLLQLLRNNSEKLTVENLFSHGPELSEEYLERMKDKLITVNL